MSSHAIEARTSDPLDSVRISRLLTLAARVVGPYEVDGALLGAELLAVRVRLNRKFLGEGPWHVSQLTRVAYTSDQECGEVTVCAPSRWRCIVEAYVLVTGDASVLHKSTGGQRLAIADCDICFRIEDA